MSKNEEIDDLKVKTKKRILIGCSGSVATVKLPELVTELIKKEFEVKVILTRNSFFFFERSKDYNNEKWIEFERLFDPKTHLYVDENEWESWNVIGDPIPHIELRRWADILLIAPASANIISKASIGITDNLLLSVMRAWDFTKPCLLCPAMNTFMWIHPSTANSLNILRSWGWHIIDPIEKKLACADVGSGAMASVSSIVSTVVDYLRNPSHQLKSSESKYQNSSNKLIQGIIVHCLIGLVLLTTTTIFSKK